MTGDSEATSVVRFEGPEKKLEIEFRWTGNSEALYGGLRTAVTRKEWDRILDAAQCTILSHMKHSTFDAFVLSESSLFVFEQKIMLKTCGTTALLLGIPYLLETIGSHGYVPEFIQYSRKNLMFPVDQHPIQQSWDSEVKFLRKIFKRGVANVMGSLDGERWHVYVADLRSERVSRPMTLEIMMSGLSPESMSIYFEREGVSVDDVTSSSGIGDLVKGGLIDAHLFEKCGYSMNGGKDGAYYTIHVTPEDDFSYVSFETSVTLEDYSDLVHRVFDVFHPSLCSVVVVNARGQKHNRGGCVLVDKIPGFACVQRDRCDVEDSFCADFSEFRKDSVELSTNVAG